MNYFLVDFENVQANGVVKLQKIQEGDFLIVFYSENCKNINVCLEILDKVFSLKLKYKSFKVNVGTKNALDFQLVSYLGYLIAQGISTDKYYIVSNDTGFDATVDFWKNRKISVSRIAETNKKKKAEASLEEIIAFAGKADAEKILQIFNSSKTKAEISVKIGKYYRDSKKAGEVYRKLKPLITEKSKKWL